MDQPPEPKVVVLKPSGAKAFRDKLRAFIDLHTDTPAPLLGAMFAAQLDLDTLRQWAAAEAQTLVVIETRAQFARDRHGIFRVKNWDVYREYVPGHGHRPLLKLSRLEVRAALAYRMRTVIGNVVPAELLRRLDALMEHDTQLVEERFTDIQLTEFAKQIRKDVRGGHFRLAIKATPALSSPVEVSGKGLRRNPQRPEARKGVA